jgi:6-pyruvoyltetrahydropterin/6-carboxytetrahydropterin synthase
VFGKCHRQHGHTYTLDVTVTGKVELQTGMIINYFDLDKIVKPIVDGQLDHKNLNEVFKGMLTTAENMVYAIKKMIEQKLPDHIELYRVTLQETPKTTAVWQK